MSNRPSRGRGGDRPTPYPPVKVNIKKGDVTKITPQANRPQGTDTPSDSTESRFVSQNAAGASGSTSKKSDSHRVSHMSYLPYQLSSTTQDLMEADQDTTDHKSVPQDDDCENTGIDHIDTITRTNQKGSSDSSAKKDLSRLH